MFRCIPYLSLSANDRFAELLLIFEIKIENNDHREHVFLNWLENDKHIDLVNSQNKTYVLEHNQFSGMNNDEFSTYLGYSNSLFSRRDDIGNKIDEVKCLTQCIKDYDKTHKLQTVSCVKDCLDENTPVSLPVLLIGLKKAVLHLLKIKDNVVLVGHFQQQVLLKVHIMLLTVN